ncbi:MAG: hypothetical protein WAJ93_23170 [Candidatus Nitrosopolaris sp.]
MNEKSLYRGPEKRSYIRLNPATQFRSTPSQGISVFLAMAEEEKQPDYGRYRMWIPKAMKSYKFYSYLPSYNLE